MSDLLKQAIARGKASLSKDNAEDSKVIVREKIVEVADIPIVVSEEDEDGKFPVAAKNIPYYNLLTKRYVRERFDYVPNADKTFPFFRRGAKRLKRVGRLRPDDYADTSFRLTIGGESKLVTMKMHRLVWLHQHRTCYKYSDLPLIVNHKNRDNTDNRYTNLEESNHYHNNLIWNKNGQMNPWRGVYVQPSGNYQVRASELGKDKVHYIGTFSGLIQAQLAWDAGMWKYNHTSYSQDLDKLVKCFYFAENKRNYLGKDAWLALQLNIPFIDEEFSDDEIQEGLPY